MGKTKSGVREVTMFLKVFGGVYCQKVLTELGNLCKRVAYMIGSL